MVEAVKGGAPLSMGVDHENYPYSVSPVPRAARDLLSADLD
jgi:hypothetical protein